MTSPRKVRAAAQKSIVDYTGTALFLVMVALGVHSIDGANAMSSSDRTIAIAAWNLVMSAFLAWWWTARRA